MPEAICGALLCMLDVVEGKLCSLEVLEVLDVPEMICVARLCMLDVVEDKLCSLEVLGIGGDTLRATLYAGRCGG